MKVHFVKTLLHFSTFRNRNDLHINGNNTWILQVDFYSRIYGEIVLISRKDNNSEIHKMKVNKIKNKALTYISHCKK